MSLRDHFVTKDSYKRSLLTVHWNLPPIPLLYLSAYFEQNRAQYYDQLQAVSERGAWVEWLYFFLLGVAEQAQDAASRARPAEFIIPRMKLENWPISFR